MAREQWSEPTVTDENRLPWLETAADHDEDGPSVARVVGMILLGLVALAGILGGIYWLKHRGPVAGNGDLIAAQQGDYKVKPDDPGGMKVDGEGDAAVAASAGSAGGNGSIAVASLPEAPIVGKKVSPNANDGPGTSSATASVARSGGKLVAPPPGKPIAVAGRGGAGAVIQLGSFPTEASANGAWKIASKRFSYLAGLGKSVQKAEVNERTFYRLRVNAGSAGAASDLCGKLKVAGEACIVTN